MFGLSGPGSSSASRSRPANSREQVLHLGEREIRYLLRFSQRRSLALQVDPRGVRVAAPFGTPVSQIEAFVAQHRDWLERQLSRQLAGPRPVAFEIVDGALLPVLGEQVRISIAERSRGARWRRTPDGGEGLELPGGGDLQQTLVRALRMRAIGWYRERVAEYCLRLGVSCPKVGLTAARTRWGSCSSRTGIRLHWRLVHLRPELIDYVVAHEVAHLREMNHSPRFWAVVESLCPQWRAARAALRTESAGLPRIEAQDGYDNLMQED